MEKRKQPETLRLKAATPSLTVNDMQTSLTWYRDIVGFFVVNEMKHDGKLMGAVLRAGVVDFLIVQDDFAKGRERAKGAGFRLYCTTERDIDELAKDIEARGGELSQQPKDQSWGARDFALVDPDGFNISISTDFSQ